MSKVFLQIESLHYSDVMSKQKSHKNKSKCVSVSVANEAA